MKKTSKILFLLTLIVLGVMMAFSVSAATAVDGIYYDLNDSNSTAAVSSSNRTSCTVENVVIPSEITVDGKTYTVTSLREGSFGAYNSGNTVIKSIRIPYTVTSIGERSFQSCSNLASVTIENTEEHPSQLKSIGTNSFWKCSSLTGIVIPKSVETISSTTNSGSGTFLDCTALETVIFEEGCALKEIQDGLFLGCTSLKELILPNTVEKIGNRAFQNCSSLTKLNLGSSLIDISGISITYLDDSLQYVYLPKTIMTTNQYAFFSGSNIVFFFDGTKEEAIALVAKFKASGNNGKITGIADARYFEYDENVDYEELRQAGNCIVYNTNTCFAFYNNQHLTPNDDGDCTTALVCERCGKVLLEAKEHNIVTVVDEATCTTDEMTHQYCTNEGCTYKTEPYKTGDALGHNTTTTVTYENGFDKAGAKETVCSRCDYNETVELPQIFTVLGYSKSETDGVIGLKAGYAIDFDALNAYQDFNGVTVEYGMKLANAKYASEISNDASENVFNADLTESDYNRFNTTIVGFNDTDTHKNLSLIMLAYAKCDGKVQYIQAETSSGEIDGFKTITIATVEAAVEAQPAAVVAKED